MGYIQDIKELIESKQVSVTQLVQAALANIDTKNTETNAFVECFYDSAIARATAHDEALSKGQAVTLGFGVPVGIKDNMALENELVSCASNMLQGYRSPFTSTAVQRLLDQGFIPVGRTNMDEFAMGSSNEYSVYGPVSNPWDTSKVSGGSSGGSAAAVASGVVPVTLGSDTGGSIRQPASFCGVVGFKPTYGRVSRYGLIAFASSLDQIGPFAQNVSDVAAMLDTICGFDPHDSTSEKRDAEQFSSQLQVENLKGKRIGVPNQLMGDAITPDVKQSVLDALKVLEGLGATVDYFDFPFVNEALATYYIIAPAEVSSNLSRFDGVRFGHRNASAGYLKEMIQTSRQQGFGDEVKRRIMLGTYVLSSGYYDAYYGKAQSVRAVVSEQFSTLFNNYDFICSPTAPTTAFNKGKNTSDPMEMYLSDIATIPVNLAGLPAMSLPCGVDSSGLPIGLQMMAPWFKEAPLLQAAHLLEQSLDFKSHAGFNVQEILNAV
jgi:aspartyl-tRNA(Asn)/glutamyl-tRNA(Gln) amidotransferase subunit A